jgi:hypothetical protein
MHTIHATLARPGRLLGALTAVVALALASAVAVPAHAAAPAERAGRHTRLTFEAAGCDGCRLTLVRAIHNRTHDNLLVWESEERTVRDGEVTFRPLRRRTIGMSVLVRAPWEGPTGYVTELVFRYGARTTGDPVSLAQAKRKRRASGCWSGTNARALTLPLTIRPIRVRGTAHRTRGTIAFTSVTDRWADPMERAHRGVLGTQDVQVCDVG